MASVSGVEKSLGSQFFITQAKYNEQIYSRLKLANAPESILKAYKEYGGYPSLFLQYTVFGQVYEGIEVVDKIAAVETNESNDKPKIDVVIEKIEVKEAE
jgi:peptidyl-prolyl cis-trans isomerase